MQIQLNTLTEEFDFVASSLTDVTAKNILLKNRAGVNYTGVYFIIGCLDTKFWFFFYCKCKSVSVISFQTAWCLIISIGPEQPHQSTLVEINPLTGLKGRGRKVEELLKIVESLRRAGRDTEGVWGSAETISGSWNRKHCRTDRRHQPAAGYHLQTPNLCSFRLCHRSVSSPQDSWNDEETTELFFLINSFPFHNTTMRSSTYIQSHWVMHLDAHHRMIHFCSQLCLQLFLLFTTISSVTLCIG